MPPRCVALSGVWYQMPARGRPSARDGESVRGQGRVRIELPHPSPRSYWKSGALKGWHTDRCCAAFRVQQHVNAGDRGLFAWPVRCLLDHVSFPQMNVNFV